MFSSDNLNKIMEQALSQLGMGSKDSKTKENCGTGTKPGKDNKTTNNVRDLVPPITPSKALVISGLLTDTLQVTSVLLDRDQTVQVVLEGSLKRKTELDKMMEELGKKPFEEVMKAFLDNFS